MPAARPPESRPAVHAGVSMRDLLASCVAADAVSRPPRAPEPPRQAPGPAREQPRAA